MAATTSDPLATSPRTIRQSLSARFVGAEVLWVLLAFTLVRGILYAVLNPSFYSPDEGAHFQYIAHLATGGESGGKGPERHQPALYYALMVPAYWLTVGQSDGLQLLGVRLASLTMLLGSVTFTWLAARRLAPNRSIVAPLAATIVALNPINTVIAASANNDGAANLAATALVYLAVCLFSASTPRWALLATIPTATVAVMTKGQVLPVVAVVISVLVLQLLFKMKEFGVRYVLALGLAGGSALALLLVTEAVSDVTQRAPVVLSVFASLPESAALVLNEGREPYLYLLVSFWSHFVGDSIHLPLVTYLAPTMIVLLGPLGYAVAAHGLWKGRSLPWRAVLLRVSLALIVLSVWALVFLRYVQILGSPTFPAPEMLLQGRFLMASLPAMALLVAEGWSLLVTRRHWNRAFVWVAGILVAFDVASMIVLTGFYRWETGALY